MKNLISWSGRLAMVIGLLALAVMLIQGPGYQAGWWGIMTSLRNVFPIVVIGGGIAILLGTISIVGFKLGGTKTLKMGLIGLLTGAVAAAVPLSIQSTAKSVPMIHDITTDTVNPPAFVAIAPLRANASNPLAYDPAVIPQQQQAYPDIVTIELSQQCEQVFPAALDSVKALGWELVAADEPTGRIEATETTPWFGFKDDVVIRITPFGHKSLVDVRSKSRIGKSDLGVNAKRIRKFRETLMKQFSPDADHLDSC